MKALTKKQSQVLLYLCRGLSDKEIGFKLGVTYNSARAIVKTVKRKFGTGCRTNAVLKFMNYKPEEHELFAAYDAGYKNGRAGENHMLLSKQTTSF